MTVLQKIPLTVVVSSNQFVLKGVSPRYTYTDGKRTETIEAFSYKLVDPESFDTFTVSVAHTVPVVTPEALRGANEAGQHILVELEEATITPYYSERTHTIEDSIKAAEIRRVGAK